MLEAAWWGFVGGGALLVGAVLGLRFKFPPKAIGAIMAFGAGVLFSAAAFELTEEASARGGRDAAVTGLVLGGLAFFAGDSLVARMGGGNRKRSGDQQQDGVAMALVLGALMDGIPESAAIGISLLEGNGVGVAVVVAVFISNIPESLSASTGLRTSGRSTRWVLALWGAVALVSALAALAGFALLDGASGNVTGGIQAFAAGAIIVMLVDTMVPEAWVETNRSRWTGLITVAAFALSFVLSTLE